MKIVKDSAGYKYKYPERTCLECKKYQCFQGQEDIRFDFAKYGCTEYTK